MQFVDTSAWFAYFLPNDPDHQRVRTCFRSSRERLVTTDYCVDDLEIRTAVALDEHFRRFGNVTVAP